MTWQWQYLLICLEEVPWKFIELRRFSTRVVSIHKYVPFVISDVGGDVHICDVNYVAKMRWGGVTSPTLNVVLIPYIYIYVCIIYYQYDSQTHSTDSFGEIWISEGVAWIVGQGGVEATPVSASLQQLEAGGTEAPRQWKRTVWEDLMRWRKSERWDKVTW